MKPQEILPRVWWVGALHPDMRIFDDLFPTANGTSYNSYLLKTAQPTLIDTVKGKFGDQLIANLESQIKLTELKYIVANHAEPDHSGSLGKLLERAPNATVLGSKPVGIFLKELLNRDFPFRAVADGETLDIGGMTLAFVVVPFLHWPDTIFTYAPELKAAFTCDALGAHYCPKGELWADCNQDYRADQKLYYDCLIRLYNEHVRKALDKVKDVPIEAALPSHGPLLRGECLARTIARYQEWSAAPKKGAKKLVGVVYLSSHGNTARMAEAVADGVRSAGAEAELCHWSEKSEEEIVSLYERADALVFGTPTINRDVPPPMWRTMALLSASALPTKRVAGVFGSFGWSGEAAKLVESRLAGIGYKLPLESVRVRFTPTEADLAKCRELGAGLAGNLG
ncbi:MAG TPA: FprA family A-type flavoprotein [Planctomycetota bacterium]|nr:FprA family A-type flavoprotein [Planctomycetota bacterium]